MILSAIHDADFKPEKDEFVLMSQKLTIAYHRFL
jgi:hypothetical protein